MLKSGLNLYVWYLHFPPFPSQITWYTFFTFYLSIFMSLGGKLSRTLGNLQVHAGAGNRSEAGFLLHRLVWGIWESGQLSWSGPDLSKRTPGVCRAAWETAAVSQVWNYAFKFVIYLFKKRGIFIVKAWLFCVCRALQARVSRQVMMNLEQGDSDDEPKQTERVHLADLKYKGKKKAIKPINRTGSAIRSKCNV